MDRVNGEQFRRCVNRCQGNYRFRKFSGGMICAAVSLARFRSTKAAVKLHTLLDLRGPIPTMNSISEGKKADVNILDDLALEPGAFYVMDRGYVDFARLYRFVLAGAFFVTRARANLQWTRLEWGYDRSSTHFDSSDILPEGISQCGSQVSGAGWDTMVLKKDGTVVECSLQDAQRQRQLPFRRSRAHWPLLTGRRPIVAGGKVRCPYWPRSGALANRRRSNWKCLTQNEFPPAESDYLAFPASVPTSASHHPVHPAILSNSDAGLLSTHAIDSTVGMRPRQTCAIFPTTMNANRAHAPDILRNRAGPISLNRSQLLLWRRSMTAEERPPTPALLVAASHANPAPASLTVGTGLGQIGLNRAKSRQIGVNRGKKIFMAKRGKIARLPAGPRNDLNPRPGNGQPKIQPNQGKSRLVKIFFISPMVKIRQPLPVAPAFQSGRASPAVPFQSGASFPPSQAAGEFFRPL